MTIQEILTDAGIDFIESGHQHTRPGWIQIQSCPFCSSIKYHLGYNLQYGYWNCWRCGYHHSFEVFKMLGIPYRKDLERSKDAAPTQKRGKLKEPAYRGPLSTSMNTRHRLYLRTRGFDPEELIRLWWIEGINISDRLAWRIYIPIIQNGQRVSWTTRAISDSHLRYISASADEEMVSHKEVVYGLDYVRDSVVVCEGPFDVWKVGPGAVCTFGLEYSSAQVRQLAQVPNRFICFDNERVAQQQAKKLAGELCCFPGRTQVVQLESKDPGSAKPEEIAELRGFSGLENKPR